MTMDTESRHREEVASGLSALFGGIMGQIRRESDDAYKAIGEIPMVAAGAKALRLCDQSSFQMDLLYPIDKALSGMIEREAGSQDGLEFAFLHGDVVRRHLEKIFIAVEGSACNVDKSGEVLYRIIWFLKTGTRVEFNPEDEWTYSHPKKVFTTHDEIMEFFHALRDLHYGMPMKFIEFHRKHADRFGGDTKT